MFPIFCPLVVAFRSISYASYTNWALNLHKKRNLTATTHQQPPPPSLTPPPPCPVQVSNGDCLK